MSTFAPVMKEGTCTLAQILERDGQYLQCLCNIPGPKCPDVRVKTGYE